MLPIFVISLKDAHERRKAMTEKLNTLGVDFTFIDAVDGRQLNIFDQEKYAKIKRLLYFGKHLTGGEWGCLKSHKSIYQKMCDENIEHAIILEDDVILNTGFEVVLQSLNPQDYDLIRFFGNPKLKKVRQRKVGNLTKNIDLYRMASVHGGAYGYYITLAGAKKMMRYFKKNKIAYPIDTILGRTWNTGILSYAVHDLIKVDFSIESDIGNERFNKRADLKGITKFLFPITRAWHKISEAISKNYVYCISLAADKALKK